MYLLFHHNRESASFSFYGIDGQFPSVQIGYLLEFNLGGELMRGDRSSYFDGWISISDPSGERAGDAAVSLTEIADRSRENAASK